jgi:hypothetical protein
MYLLALPTSVFRRRRSTTTLAATYTGGGQLQRYPPSLGREPDQLLLPPDLLREGADLGVVKVHLDGAQEEAEVRVVLLTRCNDAACEAASADSAAVAFAAAHGLPGASFSAQLGRRLRPLLPTTCTLPPRH